jgi:hypothetical protein
MLAGIGFVQAPKLALSSSEVKALPRKWGQQESEAERMKRVMEPDGATR